MSNLTPFEQVLAAPILGVGLGVDIFDDSPDYRKLIEHHRDGFDFLEVYSRGDWENTDHLAETIPADIPRTYHHEGLDPVGPTLCPDAPIEGCIKNVGILKPHWTVEELAVRHINGHYTDFFFPCILNKQSVAATVKHLNTLHDRLTGPLLPENPPFEFAVGDMHLHDYLTEVAHGANCGIVLDLGHLWSYQICVGKLDDPLDQIERLDLSRVIEVHLAGARIEEYEGGKIYRDLHGAGAVPEESLQLLRDLLPILPNLKAINVEAENATEVFACEQVEQCRKVVSEVRPDWSIA